MIVGWFSLDSLLPSLQVLLIQAPESTGKRTFALWTGRHISTYNVFAPNERLSRQLARDTIDFLSQKSDQERWAVLRLQQEGPQNILLKTLEEPPPNTKIILLAEQDPLPTVMSRAQITLRRGPLTEQELTQILTQQGFRSDLLPRAVHAGGVRQAAEILSAERHRLQAMRAGQAVCRLDRELLRRSLEGWTQECSDALLVWAAESASGIARVHTTDELGDSNVAMIITVMMNRMDQANPYTSACAVLFSVFDAVRVTQKSS